MAEVTIRFRFNRKTGKKEMVISYESDEDALPHEHERDHRALAEQLIGRKLDDDVGDVVVERISKKSEQTEADSEPPGVRTGQKEKG